LSALSSIRHGLNRILRPLNVHIDTLTADTRERARLREVEGRGQFDGPAFGRGGALASSMTAEIAAAVNEYAMTFMNWDDPKANATGFSLRNEYFSSPDAEVFYSMVRVLKPRRIIEVGSGNSTRVARMAITDGSLTCELVSVDPAPRRDVASISDRVLRQAVETLEAAALTDQLEANDILFIDSSHEIKTGGDAPFLYLDVMPQLKRGVVVHIHDIFYPYEYPRDWVIDNGWRWNEKYLVAAIVMNDRSKEVLWAGHDLQRTQPDLMPQFKGGRASSLWIRIGTGGPQ